MLKSMSILALAGMLAVPSLALAGSSGANQAELEQRIEELSRRLDELKAEMAKQKEVVSEYTSTVTPWMSAPRPGIWPPASNSAPNCAAGAIFTGPTTSLVQALPWA